MRGISGVNGLDGHAGHAMKRFAGPFGRDELVSPQGSCRRDVQRIDGRKAELHRRVEGVFEQRLLRARPELYGLEEGLVEGSLLRLVDEILISAGPRAERTGWRRKPVPDRPKPPSL